MPDCENLKKAQTSKAIPSSIPTRPPGGRRGISLYPTFALAAFLCLPASLPGLAPDLEEAERSLLKGDYQKALLLYRELAESATLLPCRLAWAC